MLADFSIPRLSNNLYRIVDPVKNRRQSFTKNFISPTQTTRQRKAKTFGKNRTKIKMLVENRSLVKNRNFSQKTKFWANIEIFVKKIFGLKTKFWSKIQFFAENRNFGKKKTKF